MQLIDKSVVVAEIEKHLENANNGISYAQSGVNSGLEEYKKDLNVWQQCQSMCKQILSFLSTLEVKEVDLEKITNEYFKDWKFDDELDIMVKPNNYSASFTDLKEIAKHFYQLGLKAQKGE